MSLLLNWRLAAALILAGFLAFTHLTAYRHGKQAVQAKWDATNVASERAAQEQASRNRELQRASEKAYVVTQGVRDHFHTVTVKELSVEAAPLADCRVPDAVRLRLNAERSCALDPAACGDPGGAVRRP